MAERKAKVTIEAEDKATSVIDRFADKLANTVDEFGKKSFDFSGVSEALEKATDAAENFRSKLSAGMDASASQTQKLLAVVTALKGALDGLSFAGAVGAGAALGQYGAQKLFGTTMGLSDVPGALGEIYANHPLFGPGQGPRNSTMTAAEISATEWTDADQRKSDALAARQRQMDTLARERRFGAWSASGGIGDAQRELDEFGMTDTQKAVNAERRRLTESVSSLPAGEQDAARAAIPALVEKYEKLLTMTDQRKQNEKEIAEATEKQKELNAEMASKAEKIISGQKSKEQQKQDAISELGQLALTGFLTQGQYDQALADIELDFKDTAKKSGGRGAMGGANLIESFTLSRGNMSSTDVAKQQLAEQKATREEIKELSGAQRAQNALHARAIAQWERQGRERTQERVKTLINMAMR